MCIACQLCNSSCSRFSASLPDGVNWELDYCQKINELIKIKEIGLLIVGQSPYAVGNTGIAFCKPTWCEMFDGKYSGKTLLCSLGLDLPKAYRKYGSCSPKDLFLGLADKGIVFVNALDSNKHRNLISKEWLSKSRYSVLCGGEAQKLSKVGDENHFHVLHPSSYNENVNSDEWNKVWAYHGALLDVIETKNHKAYTTIKQFIDDINAAF